MIDRWRGRSIGLAIVALIAAGSALAAVGFAAVRSGSPHMGAPPADWQIVVRGANNEVLRRVPLPEGRFVLRYRNSVYGSQAEERFAISSDGRMVLVELAADEAALLDEYYDAHRPRPADPGDTRFWQAAPRSPLALQELPLAATEHGRRTLVVEGQLVPLWQLVGAGPPTVILEAELG
jgi:hypothetical protein